MNIQLIKEPFGYIVIDDMYTDEELELIWREIDFLTPKLKSPEETGSAIDVELNDYKKKASALFLDAVYSQREVSDILTLNRKLFSDEIITAGKSLHPIYGFMDLCNHDTTLLNRYVDGGYYAPHRDVAVLTAVTFFIDGVGFTGGDFQFTDYNYSVEQKNNRTIIFPSPARHAVSKIKVPENGKGRYSMAQFIMMR
jgi:hypothetical protein